MPTHPFYAQAFLTIVQHELRKSGRKRYVDPKKLARTLRASVGTVLPAELQLYLADFLDGKIKPAKGRKSDPLASDRDELMAVLYDHFYRWLKRRKKRLGLNGWKAIRNADWWQGPPSERAARMVSRALKGNAYYSPVDYRSIPNKISSLKRKGFVVSAHWTKK